jgi:hypothetical protein
MSKAVDSSDTEDTQSVPDDTEEEAPPPMEEESQEQSPMGSEPAEAVEIETNLQPNPMSADQVDIVHLFRNRLRGNLVQLEDEKVLTCQMTPTLLGQAQHLMEIYLEEGKINSEEKGQIVSILLQAGVGTPAQIKDLDQEDHLMVMAQLYEYAPRQKDTPGPGRNAFQIQRFNTRFPVAKQAKPAPPKKSGWW